MAKPEVAAVLQAWITLRADDPEAVSALGVARQADARLSELRRTRLIEIRGSHKSVAEALALLHASTQFYNPHKERCVLRDRDSAPLGSATQAGRVVVWERGDERRAAAERWWRHETGESVEVREATVWELACQPAAAAPAVVAELARVRDARHGLLCNPWSQEHRVLDAAEPLPWISPPKHPS